MDANLVVGLAVIVLSVGFVTFLTFSSRKNIELIAEKKLTTVRQIMKELRDGSSG